MKQTEFKSKQDVARVSEMLKPFLKEGYLEGIPLELFASLLRARYIDHQQNVNQIPTPQQFLDFGLSAKEFGCRTTYSGQFTLIGEVDYDLHFDSIKVTAKEQIKMELINSFELLTASADSLSVSKDELFAWWD